MIANPSLASEEPISPPQDSRVVDGLQVLYTFEEGDGETVQDVSGAKTALDLTANSQLPMALQWVSGGLRVNRPTILQTSGAVGELIEALQATNEITIEVWLRHIAYNPPPLASIITLSTGPDNRHLTLGQTLDEKNERKYQLQLRTNDNGSDRVHDFMAGEINTNELSHVLFTRAADGSAAFYLDGQEIDRRELAGDFSNWQPEALLALANEPNAGDDEAEVDHAWLGEFQLAAIYNRALDSAEVEQNFSQGPAADQRPEIEAGEDQIINLDSGQAQATLRGVIIDDGLIDSQPGQITVTWQNVEAQSDPGPVIFDEAHALETIVRFFERGEYLLRLTVDNGLFSNNDEISVLVNQPPLVDAGSDQTVNLPDSLQLKGSATDPDPGLIPISVLWSKVSGPGPITFDNPNLIETAVRFSQKGVYVLRLTADDGLGQTSDEVTIVVNQALLVETGPDQVVDLLDDIRLTGTIIDDGLGDPTLGLVTVSWSQRKGPGTVSFAEPHALTTTASLSEGGRYVLKLEVNNGSLSGSDTVTIIANQAPTVEAGPDRVLTAPGSLELAGRISDDGLPDPPGSVSSHWTQVSGPDTVSFADRHAPKTTATFPQKGRYRLRLTADDGALSASAELGVVVAPAPRITDGLELLYAFEEGDGAAIKDVSGHGQALDLEIANRAAVDWVWSGLLIKAPTIITASGPATEPVGQLTASNEITIEAWLKPAQPSHAGLARIVTCSADLSNRNFTLGQSRNHYHLRLRTSETDGNGSNQALAGGRVDTQLTHLACTRSQDGLARLFINGAEVASRQIKGDFSNWDESFTLALANELGGTEIQAWLGKLHLVAIYSRALTPAEVRQNFEYGADTNLAPVVEAGPDQTVLLPGQAKLTGRVTDDRLAVEAIELSWSKVSGPGSVTLADAQALETTAGFSQNGRYVLQLTADDGDLQSSDEVTITVHQAPEISAGPDQTLALPDTARLNGRVLNDGLGDPAAGTVTVSWAKVDGPGEVSLADAHALTTTAACSTKGIYLLRLTVSNGHLEASDELTLVVNQAPTVEAGPDQIITWPAMVSLNGIISDDGLAGAGQLTIIWSQVSGPGMVTFTDRQALDTTVSFSKNGSYRLRLTVHNGYRSASDELTITANELPVVDAGPDQTVTLPNPVALDGVVSDDGLPYPPGTVTVEWSQVSGPGIVTFAEARASYTTASFPESGLYVLKFTASDGAVPVSDEVSISVNQAARLTEGLQLLYTFEEGEGGTVNDRSGVGEPLNLTIPDDDNGVRWVRGGLAINESTLIASVEPATKLISAARASNQLTIEAWVKPANTEQRGPARIVTLSLDTGQRNFTLGQEREAYVTRLRTIRTNRNGTNRTLQAGRATTEALSHLVYTFDGSGLARFYLNGREDGQRQVDGDFSNWADEYRFGLANEFTRDRTWLGELHLVAIYNRALSPAQIEQNFAAGPNANQPPRVEAGPDQVILLSDSAQLSGTVSDDRPDLVSLRWSQVQGPGLATFADAGAAETVVTFSRVGVYILRLTAHDGQLAASDELRLVVLRQAASYP